LLSAAREAPLKPRLETVPTERPATPTFGDAIEAWLTYLRVEKRRKHSTIRDARNAARAYLLPHFGAETPLQATERHEVVVMREGRQYVELREERRDTFGTDDVDDLRRELLDTHLSPRTVQKILVLLHGVFKLAKRRKLIQTNPSEDAERVTLDDAGTFNILEPVEFESIYRVVLVDDESDQLRELSNVERQTFAAMLSTAFYAGLRMGELRDLPWRNVDFARSMIRVESGYTDGARSTPKGKRARSVPMVAPLAQRLAALSTRESFTGENDYVFATPLGGRMIDKRARAVFYAALDRAALSHKRETIDQHGNDQEPIRVHDLRHSFCTWAVNAWNVTKVKEYAGHVDLKTTMRYVHHQTKAEDADVGS